MLAFIDCFAQIPVNNCVNAFTENTGIPSTYHQPSQYGFESLKQIKEPSKIIILGSAAHVTDNPPWQEDLLKYVIPRLESGTPTMGICYGHQLIAHHYGCTIDYINKEKTSIKETRDIVLEQDLFGYSSGAKLHFAYAHAQYITNLSDQFIAIGKSYLSPFEIIKHKNLPYLGTQAHPEASYPFIKDETGTKNNVDEIVAMGAQFLASFAK